MIYAEYEVSRTPDARGNERKQLHNRSIKSRLRGVEKDYRALVIGGKKAEAAKALSGVHSTYDKAVKSGVITRATANRKKSRLTSALNALK
ncbi:MAG: 30S ribosomal protein S20 [Limisphaerales bacterium]